MFHGKPTKTLVLFSVCFVLAVFINIRAAGATTTEKSIQITPSVIDEVAGAREIIEYQVKIKNSGLSKLELYVFVNDLSPEDGRQEFIEPTRLDIRASLARWINISRAVLEIRPGEERELPLKISVAPNALPGKYYAMIDFANGSNRATAENSIDTNNAARLLINLAVKDNVVERAETSAFAAVRSINLQNKVELNLTIKNIGNQTLSPGGSVIVYDRQDKEVANLEINQTASKIEAGESATFSMPWESGNRIGKFKAKLDVRYGSNGNRELKDTIFFWILPKWSLFLLAMLVMAVIGSPIALSLRLAKRNNPHFRSPDEARGVVINLRNKK